MSPETANSLLVRVAEKRDEAAFNDLYVHFAPLIKKFLMREGADAALAEDVAQQAMENIWRKAPMFQSDKGNASAWIYRIARNLRIDRFRRERVWQPLPENHNEQASPAPLADDVVLTSERQSAVQQALAALPSEQLEVVKLAYLGGMSQSEVAHKLAIPVGTVKSRMRLAYTKLAPLLAEFN